MAAYNDLSEINTLYMQRETVSRAITMLDTGGSISTLMVLPPPPVVPPVLLQRASTEGAPDVPQINPVDSTLPPTPASITLPQPNPPELISSVRAALVTMQADIDAQLVALGVTNPPARAA